MKWNNIVAIWASFFRPTSLITEICVRRVSLEKRCSAEDRDLEHQPHATPVLHMLNIEVLFPGPSCMGKVERGQAFAFEWKQVSATGDGK